MPLPMMPTAMPQQVARPGMPQGGVNPAFARMMAMRRLQQLQQQRGGVPQPAAPLPRPAQPVRPVMPPPMVARRGY